MSASAPDPYQTLGISPAASDADVRMAYRRLVQRHHPDHNGGSAESARRFEAVQDAYAQIKLSRRASGPYHPGAANSRTAPVGPPFPADLESRLADLEHELEAARQARARAQQEAREAVGAESPARPSDEQLGYIKTDDSFAKILADAAEEISERVSEARQHEVPQRVSDLIDELTAKLTGEPPAR